MPCGKRRWAWPIGHTRFIGIVETPQALPNLAAIAGADPRMAALGVGSEDLSTELEAVPGADMLYHFGMMVVAAARGAGILPLGSPASAPSPISTTWRAIGRHCSGPAASASPAPPASIRCMCRSSMRNTASPRPRPTGPAGLIAAFEAALAQGLGAVAFEGAMIDLPVVERARRLLARAR